MDVLLLLLFVGNGYWWLLKLLLFVVFLFLASVALEFLKYKTYLSFDISCAHLFWWCCL